MKKLLTILATLFTAYAANATSDGKSQILFNSNTNSLYTYLAYAQTGSSTRPTTISYTPPTGDNRGMFVVFQYEVNGNSPDYPTSITFGTKTLTQVSYSTQLSTNTNGQKFINSYMFFLNDADILASGGSSLSITYSSTSPKNGASYAFNVFTADDVLQSNPVNFCAVYQTGGNLSTNDSIYCNAAPFKSGDLFLSVGTAGATGSNPLRSNFNTALNNVVSNGMSIGLFYKTITSDTTFTPYMAGNGNAGRFILLANQIHSIGNPNTIPGSTLPIKLESFTGKSNNVYNTLSWTTATEINVSSYEIQRSANGQSFNSIGMVFSKSENGNSTTAQTYAFNDQTPITKAYYRLKIVDLDGSVSYSPVIVIDNTVRSTAQQMMVYPNPSNGTFSISGIEDMSSGQIKVTNSFGQAVGYNVISAEASTQKQTIQLNNPTPGFYYVIFEANGKVQSSKVFVQ